MTNPALVFAACLAVVLVSSYEASPTESLHSQWTQFKAQYGKKYASPAEEAKRLELFAKNKLQIDQFNREQSEEAGYTQAVNHMSDWADDEFEQLKSKAPSGGIPEQPVGAQSGNLRSILENDEPVPDSVDWRQHNRVSSVKTQGKCGSGWAFATVGVMEGQLLPIKNISEPIDLSPQNVMDCGLFSFSPCEYGDPLSGLADIAQNGGIESEKDYPYQATKRDCKFNKTLSVIENKSIKSPLADEETLKKTVAKYGPVSVSIEVTPKGGFKNYKSGVFSDNSCHNSYLFISHSVLVVGYGTDPKEGDYWLLKNSWSSDWGEGGYMKMARNKNMCGIALWAFIAIF